MSYARTLPVHDDTAPYNLRDLAADLLAQAKRNLTSNNIVVPVLQTLNVLLDADVFDDLEEDPVGLQRCVIHLFVHSREMQGMNRMCLSLQSLLALCTKNVSRLKNVHRIAASMHMSVTFHPPSPPRCC